MSRHQFWKLTDDLLNLRGPFPPLKLFKHASQRFCSNTMACVDGATQQRVILPFSTSHFQWEQKLVSQILTSIAINSFIGWRMSERVDLLESTESFKALYKYRNPLNKVQATADFMFDVSQELLSHADTPQENSDTVEAPVEIIRGSSEGRAILTKAKERKQNHLTFYNSTDGRKLRLNVKITPQYRKQASIVAFVQTESDRIHGTSDILCLLNLSSTAMRTDIRRAPQELFFYLALIESC